MDNPAINSLMETVRKINEISQRARSGDPSEEDYLKTVAADPVTEWFTGLLREKNAELQKERDRSDRLSKALWAWYRATRQAQPEGSSSEAEQQLVRVLRDLDIIEP